MSVQPSAGDSRVRLEDVLSAIEAFREERDWKQFHQPRDLAAAISIETSELQELFLWKSDREITDALSDGSLKNAVSDEVADILIYCLYLLEDLDRDPLEVIIAKLKKNREKYPAELARGRSTKYTDL
jgi:NTP pyrophosphatase (non-canonical NTP hydrolase)